MLDLTNADQVYYLLNKPISAMLGCYKTDRYHHLFALEQTEQQVASYLARPGFYAACSLNNKPHSSKTYAELQETFAYQPYRLYRSVPKNAKREVLIAELERIDAKENKVIGYSRAEDMPEVSEKVLTTETEEAITEVSTNQEEPTVNANLQQTKTFQLQERTYKQLQAYAKELREQGFYKGRLNVTREALMEGIALAVDALNDSLRERNEQAVRGNQAPRHQAGTVANLMARSKARKERENAGIQDVQHYKNGRAKAPAYKAANKAFAKAQAAPLSYGSPERKASAAFSYKSMKLDLSLTTNGCTP